MAVWRLDFGGDLFSDIWECRLHIEGNLASATDRIPGTSTPFDDVVDDVKKWWGAVGFTAASSLRWVKFNRIDPKTKHYVDKGATQERQFAPIINTNYGVAMPQLSLCVSLTTDKARGRGHRGRFYPPPVLIDEAQDSNGGLRDTFCLSYARTNAQFIKDLNNWPGLDNDATNGGQVVILDIDGNTTPVSGVSIGNVMDTQRRRRSALKEKYTSVSV